MDPLSILFTIASGCQIWPLQHRIANRQDFFINRAARNFSAVRKDFSLMSKQAGQSTPGLRVHAWAPIGGRSSGVPGPRGPRSLPNPDTRLAPFGENERQEMFNSAGDFLLGHRRGLVFERREVLLDGASAADFLIDL